MNLNAYIGLMGGSYRAEETPDGPDPDAGPAVSARPADIEIPDSDFLLTLDADSILLREYCLRLTYFLQQPDNARVAVTQTPYSSFRGAGTRIERLAGATTDIQHILHQGMSHYGATFWVGANAVIRKRALEDIVETEFVGGFEVRRFIQDRTVIEDTESSIDLGTHGWTLVNYPERLSYSATPPDFGSLIVQRRRWANGGLLILPKLWRQLRERKRRGEAVSRTELLLRVNYMASIAWASFGLIFLLAYPYDGRLLSPMVLLAALPYFLAMASDLRYAGYKATRRLPDLRLQPHPASGQPGGRAEVRPAVPDRQEDPVRPHPEGEEPDGVAAALRRRAVPDRRVLDVHAVARHRAQNWGNAAFAAFNATLAVWAIVSLHRRRQRHRRHLARHHEAAVRGEGTAAGGPGGRIRRRLGSTGAPCSTTAMSAGRSRTSNARVGLARATLRRTTPRGRPPDVARRREAPLARSEPSSRLRVDPAPSLAVRS